MTEIRAVIGLGNPGTQYSRTRHNAGFQCVDTLAASVDAELAFQARFNAHIARTKIANFRVYLAKPCTFMNRSGTSFVALSRFYKLLPAHVIVIHDELDLPVGSVKIKHSGGAGGHNGIASIIAATGAKDFVRVRLGIGRPPSHMSATPYVLSEPTPDDQTLIEDAIVDTLSAMPDLLAGNLERAMQLLHSRRPQLPSDSKEVAADSTG